MIPPPERDVCMLLHTVPLLLIIDYNSTGYSVTIGAGEMEGSENITIFEDAVPAEEDETFTNRIQSVTTTGVTLGERQSVVTIRDSTRKYNTPIVVYGYMAGSTPLSRFSAFQTNFF